MDFLKEIKDLEQTTEFKEWKDANNAYYLTHVFFMTAAPVEIGYYNPESDQIVTFEKKETIHRSDPQEAFKEKRKILPLIVSKIKVSYEEALEIASKHKSEKYPKEEINKTIAILQNLQIGQVYNITQVTTTFKTVNMKINTESGELIASEIQSILNLGGKA